MADEVYLDSFALEVGLQPHGSFRELLINEDFVQGVWTLGDLTGSRVRDISGYHRDGTATAIAGRGVSVDLPEGALGSFFDGNGYIVVTSDPDLSLPGGSMDIIFLLKTSWNDVNNRPIVQKHDGTNGYTVSLISGSIAFSLDVSGSNVFAFSSADLIDDDEWHLIHCCYEPEDNRARIFIDGVASGSGDTGTTEPQETSANLHIGGAPGGPFRYVGSLAYVMVGREGNPALSTQLQTTRSWTDITGDTRSSVQPIAWSRGIRGSSVLDNVASPGRLTFAMDNTTNNSGATLSYYSPDFHSVRPGWRLGIPVRFTVTSVSVEYPKFRGFITNIQPTGGVLGQRSVSVTCSDWMDIAARSFVPAVPAAINERSDTVLKMLLDESEGTTPAAVDIRTGSSTWPFALDIGESESETMLSEIQRITGSERGYCYVSGDGTLVWEGRGHRQEGGAADAELSGLTMHGITADYSIVNLVNIVRVVVTPRRVDSSLVVLYSLDVSNQDQAIAPGETVVFEGGYVNPDEEAVRVGGTDMAFEDGTDYAFWANSNGTGADLTANLTVRATLGGNSFRIEFTNDGAQQGFLRLSSTTAFQIRGKGIYHYTPITVRRPENETPSIRRHKPRTIQIDMPYESSRTLAESVADYYLNLLSGERAVIANVTVILNRRPEAMLVGCMIAPGVKLDIGEEVTYAFDTTYVNGESGRIDQGGIVTITADLTPASMTTAGLFDTGTFNGTMVFGV